MQKMFYKVSHKKKAHKNLANEAEFAGWMTHATGHMNIECPTGKAHNKKELAWAPIMKVHHPSDNKDHKADQKDPPKKTTPKDAKHAKHAKKAAAKKAAPKKEEKKEAKK